MKKSEGVLFKTKFRGYKKQSVDSYILAMNEQFARERAAPESQIRNLSITVRHLENQLQAAKAPIEEEQPV